MPQISDHAANRRPVVVVVILWFYILAALSLIWISFRFATGHFRLRMTTGLYAAAAVILMTVKLWGATALYRLRRSQSRFFFAAVLLNLPLTIFDIYGRPRGYQMSSIVSMFVGVLIAAGSCVYALYLERVGTLQ